MPSTAAEVQANIGLPGFCFLTRRRHAVDFIICLINWRKVSFPPGRYQRGLVIGNTFESRWLVGSFDVSLIWVMGLGVLLRSGRKAASLGWKWLLMAWRWIWLVVDLVCLLRFRKSKLLIYLKMEAEQSLISPFVVWQSIKNTIEESIFSGENVICSCIRPISNFR